jgi:hypothetical protein
MNRTKRVEMFIAIKEKMDEVVEIIRSNDANNEFLASYCFGFMIDDEDQESNSYEFLAGFNAENDTEIDAMFDAMHRCYLENSDNDEDDDDDTPSSDSIDYWLNLN